MHPKRRLGLAGASLASGASPIIILWSKAESERLG
jgi:hypothetical protein